MYNLFGFNTIEAIIGILVFLFMGIFIGFFLGLIRYILFAFMEGKLPNWGMKGGEKI